ncbi:MAG: DNA repair protein RecN [Candidatus Methylomirabilota bacterium]|jgi:DNA repair protein RecN (Recombination protein N)
MLRELTIRNVAVIEELTVTLVPGLNVLTGETGAGKSILIDALQLVLGARGSESLLRSGAEEAAVEAAFDAGPGSRAMELLEAEGIAVEPGEPIVLRRQLFRDGRTKAYAGGRLTSVATLRALGECLVDIHGQHPGQLLLDPRRHRELLDGYAGAAEEARAYRERYGAWQALRREREALLSAERERAQRQDLLEFQRREIEAARLTIGEEEALVAEDAILSNHERLFAAVEQAYVMLEESDEALLARLSAAAARVREASGIDQRLREVLEALETGAVHLREAARGLRDYRARIEFDPERLEAIQTRLHEIGKLKRKYGATVGEVLEHLTRVRADLAALERSETRLGELEQMLTTAQQDLAGRAERLSAARRRAAPKLQEAILAEIHELGMAKATFEVAVRSAAAGEEALGPHGVDEVEFLISPNPGEPLKPLHKIASGGELSRTMLAIRVILAAADQTPSLIFDEVDAGIGGNTAEIVGRKLTAVSRQRQVLCVTHLPQIACFADHHVVLSKRSLRDRTQTTAQILPTAERARELARMLGGLSRSETPVQHATELLEAANRLKKRMKGTQSTG